jgi:hypothetical protein
VKVKLNPGLADGLHAALEDRIFDGVWVIGNKADKSESDRDDNHEKSEENGSDEK